MINIFSEHITNRLVYVLDFCFSEKKQNYSIITSSEEWNQLSDKHLNYSSQELDALMTITPQGILFESEVYPGKGLSRSNSSFIPEIDGVKDELGIIFYLLSRYEEYRSVEEDQHGRFLTLNNTLCKLNLNKKPIVDLIVKGVWEQVGLDYEVVKSGFSFSPTFDIDIAWAYKNRKFMRSAGAMLKGKKTLERLRVFGGVQKDPYDTFEEIIKLSKQTNTVKCFILLGDWGKYDKNIHWENPSFQQLIKELDGQVELGIHPSYGAFLKQEKIEKEIGRLEKITNHSVTISRQHFLRMRLPDTYNQLITAGIKEDYTMGFADEIGFRAGTSFSFYYFDLTKNEQTDFRVYPFVYMDSALKDYLKIGTTQANKEVNDIMDEVREVGGTFCFIWHNSSINNQGEWKGWKNVLNYTVELGLK